MVSSERPPDGQQQTESNSEDSEVGRKDRVWKQKLKDIEQWKDALGKPIEPRIKETVAGFNLLDISTSASCEGHTDRGRGAPWIEVGAAHRPQERFLGEKAIFERVAREYGVAYEDVARDVHHEAWVKASNLASEHEENREYQKWRHENRKLRDRVSSLLEEFYASRSVPPDIRIIIADGGEGEFKVHNGGEDYHRDPGTLNEEGRKALENRLEAYQAEFRDFVAVLRDKYLRET